MAETFKIEIAEKVFEIHPLYDEVNRLCKDYITDKDTDFIITTSQDDISFEKEKSKKEDELNNKTPFPHADSYLETLSVYRKMADYLVDHNVLLFHGSVIAVDGVGYMFTAKSGTGKSTHARLWREYLGDKADMVNDDKPLLKITNDGIYAYGTPWDGKHRLSSNICVPLKAISILERNEKNSIIPIDKSEALPMLLQQSYRPKDRTKLTKVLNLIDILGSSVDIYKLSCNMDPEAAKVAYEFCSKS